MAQRASCAVRCAVALARSVLAHSLLVPVGIPALGTGMGPSWPTCPKTRTCHVQVHLGSGPHEGDR